jgi:hypothetical protein
MLSCLVRHCAIHEALTSRINSLLLQVERKGPTFEREVREIFEGLGATARKVEYRNSEGSFECDAAVLWGQDLFLVECKAYTLPQDSASDLFFFRMKQEEAANQIRRIARHIKEDPSIVARAFGPDTDVSRTTLCVINLAPFASPGVERDVKCYDRRALAKFSEGKIEAIVQGLQGRDSDATRPLARLWAGELPTPEDLLGHMDRPYQYLEESEKWTVEKLVVPLSPRLVMVSPLLKRRADRLSDIGRLIQRNQGTLSPILRAGFRMPERE